MRHLSKIQVMVAPGSALPFSAVGKPVGNFLRVGPGNVGLQRRGFGAGLGWYNPSKVRDRIAFRFLRHDAFPGSFQVGN
jgi:hypothetical protein